MRQIVQAIWWWVRVLLIVVVGGYAMLSLWNNTGKPVEVWYWFGRTEQASVVALAVASFFAGGLICSTGFALASATLRYRRTREQRRRRLIEEQREELARKAAMLRTKPPPTPVMKQKELPPENAPIFVDLRETKPRAEPERMELVEMPAKPTPVPLPAAAPPTPPTAGAVHVEATRATPFASTPAIDPRAKVAEPLPLVEESDGPVPSTPSAPPKPGE